MDGLDWKYYTLEIPEKLTHPKGLLGFFQKKIKTTSIDIQYT